ncbi:MAG: hypothetical protein ACW99U_10115 [Candidatus Thorarchaeota archaeon]|jgi:hypothetical protein
MKRALQTLLVLGITGLFLMTPVAAATSQGLEWGFAFGASFDYTLTSDMTGFVLDEEINLNVTAMPASAIPDPLSNWASIPDPTVGFWWANGSSMGFLAILFFGVFQTGGHFALPIGNFTLLQSLLAPILSGESYVDESNVWGVVWSEDTNATHESRITSTYAKADGFLAEYKLESWNTVDNELVESIQVARDVIPAGPSGGLDIVQFLQDNLLLVGGAVVALAVVCIVCLKRR